MSAVSAPLVFAGFLLAAPPASTLEARLVPLARAHKGKVAIAVKTLKAGEGYYLNADSNTNISFGFPRAVRVGLTMTF